MLVATTDAYIAPADNSVHTIVLGGGTQTVHAGSRHQMAAVAEAGNVTAASGVGVGIAVNVAIVTTQAFLDGNLSISAGNTVVEAVGGSGPSTYGAKSTSGAGDTDFGFAGSLAANVVIVRTTATMAPGAVISLLHAAPGATDSILAVDDADVSTEALAGVDSGTGDATGIGASIALSIVDVVTKAGLEPNSSLTGAHALTIGATTHNDVTTETKNGVKGGSGSPRRSPSRSPTSTPKQSSSRGRY